MQKRSDHEDLGRAKPDIGQGKLYEIGARDEWQSSLITCDGQECGTVVRKVVEPASYMVRYLVVFRSDRDHHLLVPANTVIGFDLGEIHSTLTASKIDSLPPYGFDPITRTLEEHLYDTIGVTPHWVEEESLSLGEHE